MLNFGCDQISKEVVRKNISKYEVVNIIDQTLLLTHVENTGAMLGMGENLSPTLKLIFLQIIPLTVLIVLLFLLFRKTQMHTAVALAFASIIGGGLGNLIDRIIKGKVTDFLQIKIGPLSTGIFNLADVSVTMGVIFILFYSLQTKNKESVL
jgi:signal peptidase II